MGKLRTDRKALQAKLNIRRGSGLGRAIKKALLTKTHMRVPDTGLKMTEMNYQQKIYNILIEGLSTGGSPTQTGLRVGRAMTKIKATGDKALIGKKRLQRERIKHKSAERQENLYAARANPGAQARVGTRHGLSKEAEAKDTESQEAYRAPELKKTKRKKAQDAADRGDTYGQAHQRFVKAYLQTGPRNMGDK